jgi:hypothetical protein
LTALRQGIGIWSEQVERYYIAIAMIKNFEEIIVIVHLFTKPGGVENRPATGSFKDAAATIFFFAKSKLRYFKNVRLLII